MGEGSVKKIQWTLVPSVIQASLHEHTLTFCGREGRPGSTTGPWVRLGFPADPHLLARQCASECHAQSCAVFKLVVKLLVPSRLSSKIVYS